MKKIICLLLSVLLVAAVFCACAKQEEATTTAAATTIAVQTQPQQEEEEAVDVGERTINGSLRSFSAATLGGGSFSPADFAAYDLTVINFWGTYCGPCIAEMPELAEFKQTLPSNVNFITYCTDGFDNESAAQEILDDAGMDATVIIAADGDFYDVLNQIQYIPTTLFIDSAGNIVGAEIIGGVESVEDTFGAHVRAALAEIG